MKTTLNDEHILETATLKELLKRNTSWETVNEEYIIA